MRCPRCQTRLPDEATLCPDCELPKPKRAPGYKAAPVTFVKEAHSTFVAETSVAVEPPKPIYAAKINTAKNKPKPQIAPRPVSRQSPASRKKLAILIAIPLLVSVVGAAVYWFVLPFFQPEQIEPQAAMMTVSRFRKLPSNEQGLTVDERMKKELEAVRKLDNLNGYQGWTTRPVKGDKTKVVIAFSFDQKDNKQRRAEWIADVAKNTFTPQNELAAAIYKR